MILIHSLISLLPIAILLGIGLSMDCFGIAVTHGFKDPKIHIKRVILIASLFGLFQGLMPFIGWLIVFGLDSIQEFQTIFSQIVPPLAFLILGFLGGKMIYENYHKSSDEDEETHTKSFLVLVILQAIATSIDALSSGLAFNNYSIYDALISISVIIIITFAISLLGIYLGKTFGNKVGNKAELIGGLILILVGTFILVKGEISVNAPQIIPACLEWLF